MVAKRQQHKSQYLLRVSNTILRNMSKIYRNASFSDENLIGLNITFSHIDVSPDTKNAKLFFIVYGKTVAEHKVIAQSLNKANKYFKKELAKMKIARFIPNFSFVMDELYERSSEMHKLISSQRVQQDISDAEQKLLDDKVNVN